MGAVLKPDENGGGIPSQQQVMEIEICIQEKIFILVTVNIAQVH
jgi:hypothetical protein